MRGRWARSTRQPNQSLGQPDFIAEIIGFFNSIKT